MLNSYKYTPQIFFDKCISQIDYDINFESFKINSWEEKLEIKVVPKGVSTRNNEIDILVRIKRSEKFKIKKSYRTISRILKTKYGHSVSHDKVRRILNEYKSG